MAGSWRTTVTAFTVTRNGPMWLMVWHLRLGVTRWELPGGHAEPNETLEQAAARETFEETGIEVQVGRLLATCVHEWAERRQRKLISFFDAEPVTDLPPAAPGDEPELIKAAWKNPLDLDRASISAFGHPLLRQQAQSWAEAPIHFNMTHRRNADGLWEPVPVDPLDSPVGG